ncbi:MAG: penicillin-binding protein activator, partial [Candidatus Dadabacteria bacterium]
YIPLPVIAFLLLLSGCADTFDRIRETYVTRSEGEHTGLIPPQHEENVRQPMEVISRMPWEQWPLGADLNGNPFRNKDLIAGDEYLRRGMYSAALKTFLKIPVSALSPLEEEALVMRIASTQLAVDQPADALETLSSYFRKKGLSVDQVDMRFSLVFAYAYGRLGEINQSLAWFSRVHRLSGGRGGMQEAAAKGVRMLLRSLPEGKFYALAPQWANDSFVRASIGQESRRRASTGTDRFAGNRRIGRFWEERPDRIVTQTGVVTAPGGKYRVGVLLPLSGRYGPLGQSLKNGLELAVKSQDGGEFVELIYRDTAGDSLQATIKARELIAVEGVNLIVGPLLSDAASAVSGIVRQEGVLQIAFSKRESFFTGNGVYRLAPTVKSQVYSLVERCYKTLGLRRYAVIYPDDFSGNQYAAEFKGRLEDLGLELVYERAYPPGDSAALAEISSELEAERVDAVFLPDNLRIAAQFAGNMSSAFRSRVKLLGPASWNNRAELLHSRTVLDGVLFVSPFFSESSREIVSRFNAAYRARYKKAPDFLAAQGFDAGTMLAAALKRQHSEGVPFVEAFNSIDLYRGLTGEISIAGDGEIQRNFKVVKLMAGKLVELSSVGTTPSFIYRGNVPLDQKSRQTPDSLVRKQRETNGSDYIGGALY